MTIRRLQKSLLSKRKRQLRRQREQRTNVSLETLEERRLLAFQLAGIQPAEDALLQDGDIRNEQLSELRFKFNEGTQIDPATLAGIQITRSGFDGQFESATVFSDLGTNGAVVMQFAAQNSGPSGEGIRLDFSERDLGSLSGPRVTTTGRNILIELNSNPFARTSAFQLRNVINADVDAGSLIEASVVRGNAFTSLVTGDQSFSPLILSGANSASATTDFGTGDAVNVRIFASAPGISGNGLQVNFLRTDFGGAGTPQISVFGRQIDILLNTNDGNETTAGQLVSAINNDAVANQLIAAELTSGDSTVDIATPTTVTSLTLLGANDVPVTPGFIGLGDQGNEVIVRVSNVPDDTYRIDIFGDDNPVKTALRDVRGDAFNSGVDQQLVFELDLGAKVVSIVPQPVRRLANDRLEQASDQIHVYFNDDDLDPASAESADFYQLIFTNETVRNTDDIVFLPTSVSYDPEQDRAVLEFADDLDKLGPGPGTFRLRIGTDEVIPLAPATLDAADAGSSFGDALDVTANFDTGPILVVKAGQDIDANANFVDGDLMTITDDLGNEVVFEFEDTIAGPPGVGANREPIRFNELLTDVQMAQVIANAINDAVINTPDFNVTATLDGNRIMLANDVSVVLDMQFDGLQKTSQGIIISGEVSNANDGVPFNLPLVGGSDEPGHREDLEHFVLPHTHLHAPADEIGGVETFSYNFQTFYGDRNGIPLRNAINPEQRERIREIMDIFSGYLGVQFVESPTSGFTVATGDLAAVGGTSGFGGVLGVADQDLQLLVMDSLDFTDPVTAQPGGRYFQVAMREVGQLLGLGTADELPPGTIMSGTDGAEPSLLFDNTLEPIFPGDHDIVHGQHLHRPESKDIDLYKFEITERGLFTAETIAERLPDTSLLDTNLAIWREDPITGERVKLAQNDDYFSEDSYLEMELTAGIYYIGVTASGNDQYDPQIVDTGFGGRSEGRYDLRLNFRPDADNSIVDADNSTNGAASEVSRNTALDGDADGVPGGVFNFWFRAAAVKGEEAVAGDPRVVFVDKLAAANGDGTEATPFREIDDALEDLNEGDILRIVGNGGEDEDLTTLDDNVAYQIGISELRGIELEDGKEFNVPKGVLVQIDAGAIFKMRRSRIGVGSTDPNVDRSGSGLQVLGTPVLLDSGGNVIRDEFGAARVGEVIFTSLHDTIGEDSNPDNSPPAARADDWGGLDFRGEIDKADENRDNLEEAGAFVNYVNYANISFGGGNVSIDGVTQAVDAIQFRDLRPTITNNRIHNNAGAAISANPDAFEETNFHSPQFQLPGAFTSDVSRRGPEIHGNDVADNSIDGLFVETLTPAGGELEELTVSARWDDDIVHVIKENLNIGSTPGGAIQEEVAPPVRLVTLAPQAGGTLEAGMSYEYRIVFVDAKGDEGPPSDSVPRDLVLGAGDGSVRLGQLPVARPADGFVGSTHLPERRVCSRNRLCRAVQSGPGDQREQHGLRGRRHHGWRRVGRLRS